MERGDAWARVVSAAGAAGGAVALVYVIGGLSLSLRYEGFGLPGQQAAAVTPREVLLAAGLRTLAVWVALGVGLVFAVRSLPEGPVRAVARHLRRPSGLVPVAAVAVALLMLLKVWWPFAAFGALVAIVLVSADSESRPLRRVLAITLSIGIVAVAYEADRLSYLLEWTCVGLERTAEPGGNNPGAAPSAPPRAGRRVCGVLVGQRDRGFYLGVPGGVGRTGPHRLAFIPASRVHEASSLKQLARVIPIRAEGRREPIRSRVWGLRVR